MAVGATAVWRVRPSGSNTNGGGYDAGIGGAATDYSQQNAAQASGTHGTTSGAGSTTFVDATANAFTAAMVGNAIWIASGTNFQVNAYFVTAFTSASTVTLDRTPSSGGAGSAGVWALGGGWADFWTNTTSTGPLVQGNIVYILGSGTPNPSSYVYDYTLTTTCAPNTDCLLANDPSTPGYKAPPDTTGGMPVIKVTNAATNGIAPTSGLPRLAGLWFVTSTASGTPSRVVKNVAPFGSVFDQFAVDTIMMEMGSGFLFGSEIFNTAGGTGSSRVCYCTDRATIISCNIHDILARGVDSVTNSQIVVSDCIIANCGEFATNGSMTVKNCTIDGNAGGGISLPSTPNQMTVMNCIISNHTAVGKTGINGSGGTAYINQAIAPLIDYNVFYNNTTNYTNINAGPHDTALVASPYVGSATENYTLA